MRVKLLLSMSWLAALLPGAGHADPSSVSICDDARYRGTAEYNRYCSRGNAVRPSYVPSGPSPEELKKRREEKDLREAADDADDKGVAAYKQGDWESAVKYFKEALSYMPDDADIQDNLDKAQRKLSDARTAAKTDELKKRMERSTSGQELTNMADRSRKNTTPDGAKREAGKGFDTAGVRTSTVYPSKASARDKSDPVVPPDKRTSKIVVLEQERQTAREHIAALDQKISGLDPAKDAAVITAMKKDEALAKEKVRRINLSIKTALAAPG